jgi:hypothetical protein
VENSPVPLIQEVKITSCGAYYVCCGVDSSRKKLTGMDRIGRMKEIMNAECRMQNDG